MGGGGRGARFGGSWGGNKNLLTSAKIIVKGGNTAVGRAFQKHRARLMTAFEGDKTGNSSKNSALGYSYVSKIINDPKSNFVIRETKAFGKVLDVRMPDGTGARWSEDGNKFIGFLEPYSDK